MTVSLHQIGCPGSCERVKLCPCVSGAMSWLTLRLISMKYKNVLKT